MTLDAIDQALNVALTGLIYGSGVWFACAFGLHVVGRKRRKASAIKSVLQEADLMASVAEAAEALGSAALVPEALGPETLVEESSIEGADAALGEVTSTDDEMVSADSVAVAEPIDEVIAEPSIEIIIEQPILKRPILEQRAVNKVVANKSAEALNPSDIRPPVSSEIKREPQKYETQKHEPQKPRSQKPQPQKSVNRPVKQPTTSLLPNLVLPKLPATPKVKGTERRPEIVCEPVDWKQWRVTDLRKANIAKVCGVRTRPIGSRRNLRKADLIAQYEQQLKRLTKVPSQQTASEEVA